MALGKVGQYIKMKLGPKLIISLILGGILYTSSRRIYEKVNGKPRETIEEAILRDFYESDECEWRYLCMPPGVLLFETNGQRNGLVTICDEDWDGLVDLVKAEIPSGYLPVGCPAGIYERQFTGRFGGFNKNCQITTESWNEIQYIFDKPHEE